VSIIYFYIYFDDLSKFFKFTKRIFQMMPFTKFLKIYLMNGSLRYFSSTENIEQLTDTAINHFCQFYKIRRNFKIF